MVTLHRVRVIAGAVAVLGVLLALALGLGAVFFHQQAFVTAALTALVAAMLANATSEVWRAYVFFNSGSWTSLDGRQVSRAQQPLKFRLWLTLHLAFAAIWTIGAACLIWSVRSLGL